jgi:hypothetical protein
LLAFRCNNIVWYKVSATNTYLLFCYDFLKFLAKWVLSTTTILEKYQTTDFKFFLSSLCKSNHSEIWQLFAKGRVVGIIWIKWPFSWSIGNGYYFAAFNWVLHFFPSGLFHYWSRNNLFAHCCTLCGLLVIKLKYDLISSSICLPYLKWWTEVFIIFVVVS